MAAMMLCLCSCPGPGDSCGGSSNKSKSGLDTAGWTQTVDYGSHEVYEKEYPNGKIVCFEYYHHGVSCIFVPKEKF